MIIFQELGLVVFPQPFSIFPLERLIRFLRVREDCYMKVDRFVKQFGFSVFSALIFAGLLPSNAAAQDHSHLVTSQAPQTAAQQKLDNELVATVREVTQDFKDVSQVGPDFALQFGCVSGGDYGAMGLHFVNMVRVGDGQIDARAPEILLYEPAPNGRLRLTGADYLVLAADWNKNHTHAPELNGQLFHFFDAPNRFGLPPFYTLHVWAWKDNPLGTFTNWNPNVSCDGFNGVTQ